MDDIKKCFALSGGLAVWLLVLSGSLSYGQKAKTTVTYPSAPATSRLLRELPIDVFGLKDEEAEPPRPLPLSSRGAASLTGKADPIAQTEVRPLVAATKGVDFDGIAAQSFAPSDVNLAIGPNHIVQTVNVRVATF